MIATSRKEAVLLGLNFYNTGVPCLRGHMSNRYASSGNCRQCSIDKSKKADPIKKLEWARNNYKKSEVARNKKADYYQKNIDRINKYRESRKEETREYNKKIYNIKKANGLLKKSKRTKEQAKKYYLTDYSKNKIRYMSSASARRKYFKIITPAWADMSKIKAIYADCKSKNKDSGFVAFHVDHIVPINGVFVCGLHVDYNLQVISASENLKKSNKLCHE